MSFVETGGRHRVYRMTGTSRWNDESAKKNVDSGEGSYK